MTVAQVEQLVGENRSTIDKWRARGCFVDPIRLPNGSIRYSRTAVAAWLSGLGAVA